MGKASRNKGQRTVTASVTHEPEVPRNWPEGHVSVELTDAGQVECVEVTVTG